MPLRLFATFTCLALCAAALHAQSPSPNAQTAARSAHQIFQEDQNDLHGPNGPRFTEAEYLQRVKAREVTLRQMLAAGALKTGGDFLDAAFIFQHGDTPDEFLFAHILAMESLARGTAAAKWMAATTLDRYLQFTKQPQVFGTQYITDKSVPLPNHPAGLPLPFGRTLEPYNETFLSDAIRTDFCVPTLAQQHENIALFNAGKWPRDTMHPPCP